MVNLLLVKFALLQFFKKDFILKSVYIYLALKYYWRHFAGDNYFTWSSEPGEGLAILQGKLGSTFTSQLFMTVSIGLTPRIKAITIIILLYSLGLYRLPCYPHTELVAL